DRHGDDQLPAACLVQLALVHPSLQDVQLGLAHGPLQTQQESVIVVGRVVQAVGIGQQGPKAGAQLQEVVPVLATACQAAHLQTQDEADVVEGDLGQSTLEAEPPFGIGATQTLVFVDDEYPVSWPAQEHGAIDQAVLSVRGLLVFNDLLWC